MGQLEMQLFAYAQLRGKDMIKTGELSPALGITGKQERELLSRMARSSLIIRLKRGLYLVPSRMPSGGRWGVSEYMILPKLMAELKGEYQLSGPTAFNYYGYDEQVPNKVYVYNNRISGRRTIGVIEFLFIKVGDNRLGSTKTIKTPEDFKVPMVSRARALLDAVYDWRRYNTIPRAYEWIASSMKKYPDIADEIIDCALRFGNQGTIRRIGYFLELLGASEKRIKKMKRALRSSKSLIPYIPGRPARGTINRDWGLIINERSTP